MSLRQGRKIKERNEVIRKEKPLEECERAFAGMKMDAEAKNRFLERFENKIKKLLTKPTAYDNINKLSLRQQQRTLKTEQYVKP